MPCRQKTWSLLAGLSLIALCIVCTALFINFSNSGGRVILQTLDVSVLKDGYSSFWCKGVSIVSEDDSLFFNASVVPGRGLMNKSIRQRNAASLMLHVSEENSNFLRYYLPSTTIISLNHCASQKYLTSYLIKESINDGSCSESELLRDPFKCGGIVEKNSVELCVDNSLDSIKVNIGIDDYYSLYYKNPTREDAKVFVKLSINRPFYDISTRKAFCDHVSACYLPLSWDSTETIILQAGAHGSKVGRNIVYKCHPNYISYALLFGGLPLLALFIMVAVACWCMRRNEKVTSSDNLITGSFGSSEEKSMSKEVAKGDESSARSKAYGTFDKNNFMDPFAEPLPAPSAPPIQTSLPASEVRPFISHEPPPSYEESIKEVTRSQD